MPVTRTPRTADTAYDERRAHTPATTIPDAPTTGENAPPRTTGAARAASEEFDRQVRVLVDKGYPGLCGTDAEGFAAFVEPLRAQALAHAPSGAHDATETGEAAEPPAPVRAPFLLVITREAVPIEETMPLTRLTRGTRPGFVDRTFEEGALARFTTVPESAPPPVPPTGPGEPGTAPRAYLLLGADRGEEFCGAVPNDALEEIRRRGRSPLTIEEGIAFVTLFPEALEKNKCFSLAGSRCGDRRVPAVWIGKRSPKLGWCWEGNPHTWLGMASAESRTGAL